MTVAMTPPPIRATTAATSSTSKAPSARSSPGKRRPEHRQQRRRLDRRRHRRHPDVYGKTEGAVRGAGQWARPPSRTPPRSSGSSAAASLYRRVLLVKPDANMSGCRTLAMGMPYLGDLCQVRFIAAQRLEPQREFNSRGEHTGRPDQAECRFAHHPDPRIWTPARWTNSAPGIVRFQHEPPPHPFFYRPWLGEFVSGVNCWVPGLGLPILAECSAGNWQAGGPCRSTRRHPP